MLEPHFNKSISMPTVNWVPLDLWILGFVITANLLSAWFFSNFPQHLWSALHQDPVFTKDDLACAAVTRYGGFGDLWVCPLCLGTWMSVFVATTLSCVTAPGIAFILTSVFTWPVCFYLLYGILKRI